VVQSFVTITSFTLESMAPATSGSRRLSDAFEQILSSYSAARDGEGGSFSARHPVHQLFGRLEEVLREATAVRGRNHLWVKASPGQGNWARVPWAAIADDRETRSIRRGVYVVWLFRADMSGVYLTLNQGVSELKQLHGTMEARAILRRRAQQLGGLLPTEADRHGFASGESIDLRTSAALGQAYEHSTAACKLYETGNIPADEVLLADLDLLLSTYDSYMDSELRQEFSRNDGAPMETLERASAEAAVPASPRIQPEFSWVSGMESLLGFVHRSGFVFEPWQIAAYVAAVRTKPFVILAGITGTGKSRLPRLVEEGTGGQADLVPVRPDWTDSSEVLGYVDLEGTFRPGRVLEVAHAAVGEDDVHHTLIMDEMNLARVEHYFAEVLSRIEDRAQLSAGGWQSSPLIQTSLRESDSEWGKVRLPQNLALVGTVNMDESTHGFSRKVLDRAFTLELSDVSLEVWEKEGSLRTTHGELAAISEETWPVWAWWPRAIRLSELSSPTDSDRAHIHATIQSLATLNTLLSPAQLQVGYRTRDEIALFLIHSDPIGEFYVTRAGDKVDPLDVAVQMKVLPRLAGGGIGLRRALLGILGWATAGTSYEHDEDARTTLDDWAAQGRPPRLVGARFPGVAGKACLMWDRLTSEGFTSYWL
jgi:hypothetical protein